MIPETHYSLSSTTSMTLRQTIVMRIKRGPGITPIHSSPPPLTSLIVHDKERITWPTTSSIIIHHEGLTSNQSIASIVQWQPIKDWSAVYEASIQSRVPDNKILVVVFHSSWCCISHWFWSRWWKVPEGSGCCCFNRCRIQWSCQLLQKHDLFAQTTYTPLILLNHKDNIVTRLMFWRGTRIM